MDEVIKLILEVQGQAKAADLAKEIRALEQNIRSLGSTTSATDPRMLALGTQLKATKDHARDVNDSLAKLKPTSRDMGQAVLEGSRAFEDLQYGIKGTLNQVPGLVTALGGGAGLAGAVSVVAVGANLLYQNWGTIQSAFELGGTKTEAERMEELGKQTRKTAEELAIYNRYQKDQANIKATDSGVSEASQSDQSAVTKAITEAQTRGGEVSGAVAATMMKDGKFKNAEKDARIQAYRDQGYKAAADALQAEEDTRRQDEALNASKDLVGGSVDDPNKLKSLIGYVKSNPGAFAPGLLQDLQKSQTNDKEADQLNAQGLDNQEHTFELLAKAKEDFNKESTQLNDDGLENQRLYYESQAKALKDFNKESDDLNAQGLENYQRFLDEKAKAEEKDKELRAKRAANPITLEQQMGTGAYNRENALGAKIAEASGLQDPVTQALMAAKFRKAGDRNYMTKFNRLGFEDQQAEIGRQNDIDDKLATADLTKALMRKGISGTRASKVAEGMVAQARAEMNGQTGDLSTKAQEELTKETKDLVGVMQKMSRDGIPMRLN